MSIGKIGPFDVENDSWDQYVDRLDQYFVVNDIKPALKVATLITVVGSSAYELMVNLCTPDKPSTKGYDDLVSIMKGHLQPKPSSLAERFKFRQRIQGKHETIADYVTDLKKLTKDCKFTPESMKENIRDQFICGLSNENIRQRLFTEPDDIEFKRAYQIAISMEAAETNAALVEDRTKKRDDVQTAATSVHQLSTVKRSTSKVNGDRKTGTFATMPGGGGSKSISGASNENRCFVTGKDRYGNRKEKRITTEEQNQFICVSCGGRHHSNICKFKKYVCRVCNKQGHLKKVCPNMRGETSFHNMLGEKVLYTDSDSCCHSEEANSSHCLLTNNSIHAFGPYIVDVLINDVILPMEIDTGSAIACISSECYRNKFQQYDLQPSDLSLRYYTGERIIPTGKLTCPVQYNDKCKLLDLYVIDQGKTNLLGRQWISELGINLPSSSLNNVYVKKQVFNVNDFSSRYYEVFAEGLGRFTGGAVGFRLKDDARPVFLRARPLAYALREPVERALDQLVRDGVITPVNTSDWATPIVPVMKKDGTIRVCGDFKLTLNKCLEVDRFPLARIEDLLAKLHGGNKFTKLDLSQAYAQFELDDSKKFTVINTHRGLFMYNRLIYGLASSPGIFQRKIEQLFSDLPRVGVFLDDLIITGTSDEEHLQTLHEVFRRLQKYGLKVKKEKCTFFAESVTYLGFVISKKGVQTCQKKIEAIQKVPAPKNITELRSFLGLVMYYAKFVKNISMLLSPLYTLLKKEVKFHWDESQENAFREIKKILSSSDVLAHYSPDLPLVLTTDASSVGVGAVISHLTPEGEKPIAYASRTLNSAEKSYSQIEREALAIIYGVRKFHQYLYGRKFTLRTDHKPLVSIFGDKTGIPVMAASRMQRWAVLLAGYHYDIEYVRSERNAADALSRLPTNGVGKIEEECTYLNFVQDFLPVDRKLVQRSLEKDEILKKVMQYVHTGWPATNKEDALQPYFLKRNELYLDMGCLVWGYRLVIPTNLREKLLKELHVGHMGIVKMKIMARSCMWWPGIDTDIERACRDCEPCAMEGSAPTHAPPNPWPYHSQLWTRLHVDFLGPLEGKTYFIMIDSTSKWLEVHHMQKTTASAVIRLMREIFARFGLPKEVVSDNGPPFTSNDYIEFMTNNGIKTTYSPAYHPSSNGAAEGAVKLIKRTLKKAKRENIDVDTAPQAFLLSYRNVEHSTTGVSPAMILQRRSLQSRLDLLKGERQVEDRVSRKQDKQVESAGGKQRHFKVGDSVWVRNYAGGRKWESGQIKEKLGSRNYIVSRENGPPTKKHVDQVKSRWASTCEFFLTCSNPDSQSSQTQTLPLTPTSESDHGGQVVQSSATPANTHLSSIITPQSQVNASTSSTEQGITQNVPRPILRPRDTIKPAKRYGFDFD